MIPKCGWCGIRIWPWSRNVTKTVFGMRHVQCHIERNNEVGRIAVMADLAELGGQHE